MVRFPQIGCFFLSYESDQDPKMVFVFLFSFPLEPPPKGSLHKETEPYGPLPRAELCRLLLTLAYVRENSRGRIGFREKLRRWLPFHFALGRNKQWSRFLETSCWMVSRW